MKSSTIALCAFVEEIRILENNEEFASYDEKGGIWKIKKSFKELPVGMNSGGKVQISLLGTEN